MRAGDLDRLITIEQPASGFDVYGATTQVWTKFATMRAKMMQISLNDLESASRGNTSDKTIVFRTRWLDGLTLENRIIYEEQAFTVRQIKELGRRVGLDITCERVGP